MVRFIIVLLLPILFSITNCIDVSSLNVSQIQSYDLSSFDMTSICLKFVLSTVDNINEECSEQLNVICHNLTILHTMVDAASKFPYSGMAVSLPVDNGNFDECVGIDHTEKNDSKSVRVLGKHCGAGFIMPSITLLPEISINLYSLATCIPDKCTAEDLINITGLPLFNDAACITKEGLEYTKGDISIIAIFGAFGVIIIISTLYDVLLHALERRPPHDVFLAFSFLTNGKKLFQTTPDNKEQISVFNGIRFYSMIWVLFGHSYAMWLFSPLMNQKTAFDFLGTFYSAYIQSAPLAVDTFFYISGFLFAYLYFKGDTKPVVAQIKQVPLLYIHRYIRLTPALLMVYLFNVGILRHMVLGPQFPMSIDASLQPCYDHWWSLFGYFQNYYDPNNGCIATTWYICADMQMFILAPLVAIPVSLYLKRNFKVTMIALLCMNIFFTLLPFIYIIWEDLYRNNFATDLKLIDYGIGFMMGTYMRERKHQPFKFNKIVNIVLWTICIGLLAGCILMFRYVEIHASSVDDVHIFSMFMRPAWCIGLSWIVYACYHNRGGFVNWILTLSSFQVGSRLTYSMYLLHLPWLMALMILHYKTKAFFSDFNAFYDCCGVFVTTFFFSIVWVLAFESPMITIEKFIFGGQNKNKKPQKSNVDIENVPEQIKHNQEYNCVLI